MRTVCRGATEPSLSGAFICHSASPGYGTQFWFGENFDLGRGVLQDYAQAASWYHMAAWQGLAEAQLNLGFMFEMGRARRQNYVEALKWYNLATAGGNKAASKFRDSIAKKMTVAEVLEAQRMAREWLAKHGAEAEADGGGSY